MAVFVECNQSLDEIKRQLGLVVDPSGSHAWLQFLSGAVISQGDHDSVNLYSKIVFPTGTAGLISARNSSRSSSTKTSG